MNTQPMPLSGELPQPLVSTEWLAGQLGKPDVVVLDASYYLAHEGRDAVRSYAEAHIPGAQFFDIDLIAEHAAELPHMVPTVSEFAAHMRRLNVSNRSRVICYDQRGLFSAARAWWMLRFFGHGAVAVLDGGLPKWLREGRAVVSAADGADSEAATLLPFHAQLRPELLRSAAQLLANIAHPQELVLDARSRERFHARAPEPRPGLRGGHIPGARSLPFGELLRPDGTLLASEQLRDCFAALGALPGTPVVASCGSGITAAVLLLALAAAGYPDGALYDGSWAEWGARAEFPVAVD